MRNLLILLFCGNMLLSCKSKPINQKVNHKKEGVWIEMQIIDGVEYKSFEYYKNDLPAKKWKSYVNGKIHKTEKYKKRNCIVKYYYENGKIESIGKTKTETTLEEMHWFYFGEWKYYSEEGKLTLIRNYDNGQLISEQKIE